MVNTLDHLPLLPLFVHYHYSHHSLHHSAYTVLGQDEFKIYHTLRSHGRIRHMKLSLPPSILQNVLPLMKEYFPILEHLYLSSWFSTGGGHRLPLTLPKTFLAPNLQHLTLIGIGLPKRLRVLTSALSLVTLELKISKLPVTFARDF